MNSEVISKMNPAHNSDDQDLKEQLFLHAHAIQSLLGQTSKKGQENKILKRSVELMLKASKRL